ncbi:MAG: acyl-CoA dehydrogenase [Alphaproteobacteria bacterium]|nr:acyl-CoA dehydrogenase [Alphaproteobacteria bacterium]HCP00060.1 acyl-CoA dehydrogenase [Rhodospirillaceae bacterium]
MPDRNTFVSAGASELKLRAAALEPDLVARAAATEALRRLPDETIAELKVTGLHRICQPARFGGAEASLNEACDIVAMLARGCSSTGWVVGVYTDHQILIGMFDPRAADDVWGENPDALVSAGFTPGGKNERVDGGWQISGSWDWSSGCDHADWLILGCLLPTGKDDVIEPNYCVVSRDDVTLEDNWHVMGLSGSGSKSLHVESAFVPDYRALSFRMAGAGGAARGQTDAPALYRLPHPPCVPFMLAAPALGIAESLLDLVISQMVERSSRGVGLAEHQTIQLHIAEAAAQIDAARLMMARDTGEAMEAMREGRELGEMERVRNRRDQAYLVRECRAAVDRLFTTLGGDGIFLDNALQRKFRDMHAISGHFALNWDVAATTYGRVTLGLESTTHLK